MVDSPESIKDLATALAATPRDKELRRRFCKALHIALKPGLQAFIVRRYRWPDWPQALEEILNLVFQVAIRISEDGDVEKNFNEKQIQAFFLRIANNKAIDEQRRRARRKETALDYDPVLETFNADELSIHSEYEDTLKRMTEKERGVYGLRAAGLSWKKIAALLDESADSLKQQHNRMLKRLRRTGEN